MVAERAAQVLTDLRVAKRHCAPHDLSSCRSGSPRVLPTRLTEQTLQGAGRTVRSPGRVENRDCAKEAQQRLLIEFIQGKKTGVMTEISQEPAKTPQDFGSESKRGLYHSGL
jgi:hypothetical protein